MLCRALYAQDRAEAAGYRALNKVIVPYYLLNKTSLHEGR